MQILDCTFRDGGYYTDWNFSNEVLNKYLNAVSKLPISIVELGYISNKRDQNGPFFHLDKTLLSKTKSKLRNNQKVFAMINFKEISNSNDLYKLLANKQKYLDGVRFAINPKDVVKFLKIILPVKKKIKGLSFNVNLMYASKWYNKKNFIINILSKLKNKVDTIAFVDSYGALTPKETYELFEEIYKHKNSKFKIGCHFHNNCGLALANSIIAKNYNCDVIDTTFRGMGRGAGNAETELLLAIDNLTRKKIDGFELTDLLDDLEEMKNNLKWGSSFPYAFAARNGFSQSLIMDLIQKRRLDPGTAINVIAKSLQVKKVKFENLKTFSRFKKSKSTPILIGGGPSFKNYGEYFFDKIDKNIFIILSGSRALFNLISLNKKVKNPIILIASGSEFKKINLKLLRKLKLYGIIAEKEFIPGNIKLNFRMLKSNSVAINPVLLTGLAVLSNGLKKLDFAFFDGNPQSKKDKIVMEETNNAINFLNKKGLNMRSLTKNYLNIQNQNLWI